MSFFKSTRKENLVSVPETKSFISDALFYLNILGANPNNQTSFTKIRLLFFTSVSFFLMTLILLEILINWQGVLSLLGGGDAFVALVELKIKLIVMFVWQNKIIKILKELENFWPEDEIETGIKKELQRIHKFIERFIRGLKICYWSTFALYGIKPLFNKNRELPLKFYQPFDLLIYPRYEIVCFLQLMNSFVFTSFMLGFDFLFITLVIQSICELKLIKYKLNKLKIEEDYPNCMSKLQVIVDHHNFILRFIRKISDLFSMIMLSEFVVSTFCICLGLLSLSKQGFPPTLPVIIQYGLYLMAYSIELYIYCVGGDFLTMESESVADAVYNCEWWARHHPQFAQAICLIILRSQKGEKLSAGDMFNLNLRSFTSVMNTGLSYFALMRAIYAEQNE